MFIEVNSINNSLHKRGQINKNIPYCMATPTIPKNKKKHGNTKRKSKIVNSQLK